MPPAGAVVALLSFSPFIIISTYACFPLTQPGFYSAPSYSYGSSGSYGSGGSYGAPYAAVRARAMAPGPSRPRLAASADDTVVYDDGSVVSIDGTAALSAGCSHRFIGRRLNCSTPIETRTPVNSETDCRQVCIDYLLSRCASYRFDTVTSLCELYDSIPPLPVVGHSSNSIDRDADLFPFRDEITPSDDEPADYEMKDSKYIQYSKKSRRSRRFTPQNGVASAATSRDSASNALDAILKLPGLLPTGQASGCTPTIASADPSSVFATVDVECFKRSGGGGASADLLAPLIAQFHRGNAEIGRALAPLSKTLAPSPSGANANPLALPALPSLTELLTPLQPQSQAQSQGLGGLGPMLMSGLQSPSQTSQLQPQNHISNQNAMTLAPFQSQSQQPQGQMVMPFMTPTQSQQPQILVMPPSSPPSQPVAAFSQNTALQTAMNIFDGVQLPSRHRSSADRNPNRIDVEQLAGAIVVPDMPDCANGMRAHVQAIDGISVVGGAAGRLAPLATIRILSAETCLHICRANAHLDGTRFARACRAAAFDRVAGSCLILDEAITPNGELGYAPSAHGIYIEKFCVPENELPLACDDVVQRIPQHTLDARAAGTGAVLTAASQTECLRRCITAQKRLGFECSSVSYYFDWEKSNCYLSRFTRLSRPDLYVGEHKQLVDYLELAPCMRKAWQHDDIDKDETASFVQNFEPSRAPSDPFRVHSISYNDESDHGETRMNIRRAPARSAVGSQMVAGSTQGGAGGSALVNGVSVDSVFRQDVKQGERKESSRESHEDLDYSNRQDRRGAKALGAKVLKITHQFDDPRSVKAAPTEWLAWSDCDTRSGLRSRRRAATAGQNHLSANESDPACQSDIETVSCGQSAVKARDEPIDQNRADDDNSQKEISSTANTSTAEQKNTGEQSQHESESQRSDETDDAMINARGCNPRARCCSKVLRVIQAPRSAANGCAIGYRVLGDGTTVACMADDC